jgi:hypothetical protein
MKIDYGDIWFYHALNHYVVVPVNECLNKSNEAVMGKGVAYQAKKAYPMLPKELGERMIKYGSRVFLFMEYRIITFPTKADFDKDATLDIILRSAIQLSIMMDSVGVKKVYIPTVGCGAGNLKWADVKKVISPIFSDDRYIVLKYLPMTK